MGRAKVEIRDEELERQLLAEGDESLFQLNPETMDSSLHYRFVRETPARMMKAEARGYRLVNTEIDTVRLKAPVADSGTADGRIRVLGQVLMCCDKTHYEHRVAARHKFNQDRMRGPQENFKAEAEKGGYSIITSGGPE